MAEVFEHHRARPDLADWIGDAFAVDVGRRPVHGFEQRRKFTFRIDVGRRRNAYRSRAGGPEVGEDVAEQVGADNDVEPVGMHHEMRSQNVDVILVGLDVGILR